MQAVSAKAATRIEHGVKVLTMIYVVDYAARTVLLGHKVRGFGALKWNGFGGKVDPTDPSIVAGAMRELHEECGLVAPLPAMHRVGVNYYRYPDELEKRQLECHIYVVDATTVEGAVTPSEEMNPIEYIPFDAVPLDKMWVDDPHWLPQLLDKIRSGAPRRDAALHFVGFYTFTSFEALSADEPPVVVWGSEAELVASTRADR